MLHVKKPQTKPPTKITITIKKPKPPSLAPPIVFPGRPKSKTYRRKKPLRKYTGSDRIVYSPTFANKPIQYVALIICHGSSCEAPRCVNPIFETKYDYVSTAKYGNKTSTYGIPQQIYNRLCTTINNPPTPFTGSQFMNALQTTISTGKQYNEGKLQEDASLKQHDQGSRVSDLNIFQEGLHSQNSIEGIYLFEVGKPCEPSQNHNAMTVDPAMLFVEDPKLLYVAQTAMHLQSFIEPTEYHGRADSVTQRFDTRTGKIVTRYRLDRQYRLKKTKEMIRLSDVLGIEGIFPPNTVVVSYVCRVIPSLPSQSYDSPDPSDYTSTSSSSSMSESHSSDDGDVAVVSGPKPDSPTDPINSLHGDKVTEEEMDAFLNLLGGAIKHRKSLKKRRR